MALMTGRIKNYKCKVVYAGDLDNFRYFNVDYVVETFLTDINDHVFIISLILQS